jgi:Undecaprenyl-phosphate glucose phosphotransferase
MRDFAIDSGNAFVPVVETTPVAAVEELRHAHYWWFASDACAALLVGLFLADIAVVIGAGIGSCVIWYGTPQLSGEYWIQIVIGCAVFFPMMQIAGMYRFAGLRRHREQLVRVTVLWAVVLLMLMAVIYLGGMAGRYSRAWMMLWASIGWFGLIMVRVLLWQAVTQLRSRSQLITQIVVVGQGAAAWRCAQRLQDEGKGDVKVVGVFAAEEGTASDPRDAHFVGGLGDLARFRTTTRVDEIVVAMPCNEILSNEILGPAAPLGKLSPFATEIKVGLDCSSVSGSGHAPLILMPVHPRPLAGLPTVLKRAIDILGSAALIALTLPLMALIAAVVKLDSPGPALFRQQRYGFNRRPFRLYKFRSMHVEASPDPAVPQARRQDPRVTRVGRLLRRTSLDELPQLFNVLKGEMSLVGPRPHPTPLDDRFAALIDGYVARHRVKPGITGWAQVNGWRGETDTLDKMQRRIEYDLRYIDNWSLLLDLRILCKTLVMALCDRNAY